MSITEIKDSESIKANKEIGGTIAIFIRYSKIIQAVRTLPIATSRDIQINAMPDLSYRSSQRYLKDLVEYGYIRRVGDAVSGYRYYPTEKIKQMFGAS